MRKKKWKIYLIAGIALEFLGPCVLAVVFGLFDAPLEVTLPLVYFTICFGVVLFALSLAKKRIETGQTKEKRLLRALTPAQICLIASMVLMELSAILEVLWNDVAASLVSFLSTSVTLAAGVLAGIRGINQRIERKKTAASPTYFTPAKPTVPKESCERCGTPGELVTTDGHKYCKDCLADMQASARSELAKPRTKCHLCGDEYEKNDMIFVDDVYLCRPCFASRYTPDGKEPAFEIKP